MSKSIYKNYIKFVIIIGIIAYIIMFVYTFFVQDIETHILQLGTVEQINSADGIITRSEEVVTLNTKDTLYPMVSSGERVSKGQVLATIKTDKVKDIEDEINKLNEELGHISPLSSFNSDIKTLDVETNSLLEKLIEKKSYKSFETLANYKDSLNKCLQGKIYKIGDITSEDTKVNEYILKMNSYNKALEQAKGNVTSTMAGTVVYKLDGYEKLLTVEQIPAYTVETLENFNIPKGELVGTRKVNSFKIVDNLECYITVLLDTEEAEDAYVDQKVKIRFPEIDTRLEVTGTIDYITFTPEGNLITFKINRGIEAILNYRKTKVEIVWESEKGYKVPSNAILKDENGGKVYLYLGRNYIVEKNVEIKKEYNDYAIIEGNEGDKLYLYDRIILDIKNVNLNKMLKKQKNY